MTDPLLECSDPPCATGTMASISPMHPLHYLDLACDAHRQRFIDNAASDYAREFYASYEPDDEWRAAEAARR